MQALFSQFGLHGSLLIAQMINFGILFFVLYRFAYKPILKILEERRAKIETSLKEAKAIEERTRKIEQEIAEKIAESQKKAHDLIKEAKTIGETTRQELITKANHEVTAMIDKAKADIQTAKDQMMNDIKNYIVKTSLIIIEKILKNKLAEQTKNDLVSDTIKEIHMN